MSEKLRALFEPRPQPQCPHCGRGPGNGPDLTSQETVDKVADIFDDAIFDNFGVSPSAEFVRETTEAVLRAVQEPPQ